MNWSYSYVDKEGNKQTNTVPLISHREAVDAWSTIHSFSSLAAPVEFTEHTYSGELVSFVRAGYIYTRLSKGIWAKIKNHPIIRQEGLSASELLLVSGCWIMSGFDGSQFLENIRDSKEIINAPFIRYHDRDAFQFATQETLMDFFGFKIKAIDRYIQMDPITKEIWKEVFGEEFNMTLPDTPPAPIVDETPVRVDDPFAAIAAQMVAEDNQPKETSDEVVERALRALQEQQETNAKLLAELAALKQEMKGNKDVENENV